jgi:hypothetical protein
MKGLPVAIKNEESQRAPREPNPKLIPLGNLEDILNSQASAEFKAVCVDLQNQANAKRKMQSPSNN